MKNQIFIDDITGYIFCRSKTLSYGIVTSYEKFTEKGESVPKINLRAIASQGLGVSLSRWSFWDLDALRKIDMSFF